MQAARFGDVLKRLVPISGHDVDEVLEEQSSDHRHRRFGEIALSMGLCQPEHVWQAWCEQLITHFQHVNLGTVGIDTQSIDLVPFAIAHDYRAVPLRSYGEQIVIVTDEANYERAVTELPGKLQKKVRVVVTDSEQVDLALAEYYPRVPIGA